jgi:hypothetical protein
LTLIPNKQNKEKIHNRRVREEERGGEREREREREREDEREKECD